MFVEWIVNLNQSLEINPGNLFYSEPLLINKNKIVISTNNELYILDSKNGSISYKKPIISAVKPLVNGNNLFIVTKDNLLVLLDLRNNQIIYSLNIAKKLADFLATKQKLLSIQSTFITNNKLLIFLDNSFVIVLNVNGNIEGINKLPTKIKSKPIFVNSSMIYLDKNNKINILN